MFDAPAIDLNKAKQMLYYLGKASEHVRATSLERLEIRKSVARIQGNSVVDETISRLEALKQQSFLNSREKELLEQLRFQKEKSVMLQLKVDELKFKLERYISTASQRKNRIEELHSKVVDAVGTPEQKKEILKQKLSSYAHEIKLLRENPKHKEKAKLLARKVSVLKRKLKN